MFSPWFWTRCLTMRKLTVTLHLYCTHIRPGNIIKLCVPEPTVAHYLWKSILASFDELFHCPFSSPLPQFLQSPLMVFLHVRTLLAIERVPSNFIRNLYTPTLEHCQFPFWCSLLGDGGSLLALRGKSKHTLLLVGRGNHTIFTRHEKNTSASMN